MEHALSDRSQPLYRYLIDHQPPEHEELIRLRELTAKMPNGFMQIAPEQGHLLAFFIKSIAARSILELGTFTGYSALTMALAASADAHVTTCDLSQEGIDVARPFWERAGMLQKIEIKVGPALDTLRNLGGTEARFDFAFIDANKGDYDRYYEAVLGLMRVGGIIALDNVLRHGRVADAQDDEPGARVLRELNAKIASDERVDRVMLPIRDGMTFVRRR